MKTWVCAIGLMVGLTGLPVAAQDRFTGDLCGNKADIVLKTPGPDANSELKKFFGVWGKGEWDNGTCFALAVTEVNGNVATIQYFYGTGAPPDSVVPGSFVKTDAVMKGNYLSFTSMKGFPHSYQLVGGQLKGWVGQLTIRNNLQKLQ